MWLLESTVDSNKRWIRPNTDYHVGRNTDSDYSFPEDKSVSRKHATITVGTIPGDGVLHKSSRPTVTIVDHNSKFGTFINEERVKGSAILQEGGLVRFGPFQSAFRLTYYPVVICCSGMRAQQKTELLSRIAALDMRFISAKEWDPSCTHLLMPKLTVTEKVVLALAGAKPIIGSTWLGTIEENTLALEHKFELPSVRNHLPPITDKNIRQDQVDFFPNPERSKLFCRKTFVAFERQTYVTLEQTVRAGGGDIKLCVLGETIPDRQEEVGHFLSQYKDVCPLHSISASRSYAVTEFIRRRNLRFISTNDLGHAMLYNSTAAYCNPAASAAIELAEMKKNAPAYAESQNLESQFNQAGSQMPSLPMFSIHNEVETLEPVKKPEHPAFQASALPTVSANVSSSWTAKSDGRTMPSPVLKKAVNRQQGVPSIRENVIEPPKRRGIEASHDPIVQFTIPQISQPKETHNVVPRKRTARAYLNNFLNDDDDDEGANKIGQAVDKAKVAPPQTIPSIPRTANAYLDALLEDEDESVPPPTVARGSSVAVSGFIDADAHQPQAEAQPSPIVEPEADAKVDARSTRKRPYSNVEEDGDIRNMPPKIPMKPSRRIHSIIPEREIDVVGQVKAIREKRKKAEDALMPSLPRGIVDATEIDGAMLSDEENLIDPRESIVSVHIVPMIHNSHEQVRQVENHSLQNFKVFRKSAYPGYIPTFNGQTVAKLPNYVKLHVYVPAMDRNEEPWLQRKPRRALARKVQWETTRDDDDIEDEEEEEVTGKNLPGVGRYGAESSEEEDNEYFSLNRDYRER